MLHRLPLRLKLLATIAIPVALLLAVAAAVIVDRSSIVDDREAEVSGVDRATQLLDVVTALQAERNVLLSAETTNADLAGARQGFDQAVNAVLTPSFGLEANLVADVEELRSDVQDLRAIAGDDMDQFRQQLGQEIQEQRTQDPGTNSQVILTLNPLTISAIEFVSFATGTEPSTSAAADIQTTKLLTHYQEAVFQEVTGYALLAQQQLPNTPAVAAFVNSQGAATELWEGSLIEFGGPADRGQITTLIESPMSVSVTETRNDLRQLAPNEPVIFDVPTVMGGAQVLVGEIEGLKQTVLNRVSEQAAADADAARSDRLFIVGAAVGLALLLAALLTALYRSIRRPIVELTERSHNIAEVELPATVARFRDEELTVDDLDVDLMAVETNDEVGQLVGAFNAMHGTAVELASEQAASRRVVGEMFVNLGRRNQKLLNRLLASLDQLEREEEDPEVLDELFKVDHLATRMRRNAESLLILAGAQTPRQWDRSIEVGDVVRAALSEVEEFDRVDVTVAHDERVHGTVVADLAHTLAELIENALSYSHPDSRVEVVARWSHRGYQLTVTDRGLGIGDAELASLNERISTALTADETPSRYLGLYVVGRLAGRHGFQVGLFESPQGGTSARVVLTEDSLDRSGREGELTDPKEMAALASTTTVEEVEQLERMVNEVARSNEYARSTSEATVDEVDESPAAEPATISHDSSPGRSPDISHETIEPAVEPAKASVQDVPAPAVAEAAPDEAEMDPALEPVAANSLLAAESMQAESLQEALGVVPDSPAGISDVPQRTPGAHAPDELQAPAPTDGLPTRTPGASTVAFGFGRTVQAEPVSEAADAGLGTEAKDPLHVAHVFDSFTSGVAKAEEQLDEGEES